MTRRIAALMILGAALVANTAIVGLSLDRRMYFFYGFQDQAQWQYPTGVVVFAVVASLIQAAILFLVIVPVRPSRVWMRALGGLAIMCPWTLFVSQFVMHAPRFWHVHVLWTWLVVATLAAAVVVSGAMHAHSRVAEINPQQPRLLE